MEPIAPLVAAFASSVAQGAVDVYNEFSLQHELGIFLRGRLPGRKVQFERNVRHFFPGCSGFVKREIDISVFGNGSERECAIELKYPRNGQHPEQMFAFCKDICFIEQLHEAGFARAAFVAFADDPLFYQGSCEGIYGFFRGSRLLQGTVQKPTGSKEGAVKVRGPHTVVWHPVSGRLKYAVIEVAK